ncbi:MAG: PH domain-containing protein [Propionibacteriaceae bacterium]
MRTHWTSPLVKAWFFIFLLGFQIGKDFLNGGFNNFSSIQVAFQQAPWWLWLLPVLLLVLLAFMYWGWWTTRYYADAEEFRFENTGPFSSSQRIAYAHIRSVETQASLGARLLRLAEVQIDAGGTDKIKLKYLTAAKAIELRATLLNRAHLEQQRTQIVIPTVQPAMPVGVAPDELVLARLTLTDLVLGTLISWQFLVTVAGIIIPIVISLCIDKAPLASLVVPFVLGLAGYLNSNILKPMGHTVGLTSSGALRTSCGLTTLTTRLVPAERVLSVSIIQPQPWRWLNRWKVTVALQSTSGEELLDTDLLPIGTREQVIAVLGGLWPTLDAAQLLAAPSTVFQQPPRRARWVAPLTWSWAGWRIDQEVLLVRSGTALVRTQTVIPHRRVMSAALSQGPWQRRHTLATVTISVPKKSGGAAIEHLDASDARRFLDYELAQAKLARNQSK